MKVVLLDNIKGVGKVGEVKEVNDGYARNFLIRRGLGKPATAGAVKESEQLKAAKLEARALAHAQAQEIAQRLAGTMVTLAGKANPQGKLFSSVTAADIAERVSAAANAHITASAIKLNGHLKTLGEHEVEVQLTDDIATAIHVVIEPLA
ncbi:MAG: 50S ribosomal protein L9 [Candidatus Yanofskybacteria bacterium]|nr:50S ribosomal protein L9 [Candidatus Yanofskybacteria bacterium]